MKTYSIIVILFFFTSVILAQENNAFTDARDAKTYKTIQIGTQTFMAENLCFKPGKGTYHAYEDEQKNIQIYGYLYDWETANKVCPMGWHLPSDYEWKTLELYLGMPQEEADLSRKRGEKLGAKIKSQKGWYDNGNGDNSSNFNALPAGAVLFYDQSFQFLTEKAYFWTSTPADIDFWARTLSYDDTYFGRSQFNKSNCMSVRCLKNE